MKNVSKWKPSKVVYDANKKQWTPKDVGVGSRFVASLQATHYPAYIKKHAKGELLDCGSGNAPYYQIYKPFVDKVYCVDWSSTPHELTHADKIENLNEKIPYKDNSFDTILLSDVLEHIKKPAKLIGEIERTLKNGGNLICFVPFMYWIHEEPYDYHRYTRFALQELCEDAGLEVLVLKPYGGGPDVLVDILSKLTSKNKALSKFVYAFATRTAKTKWYKRLKTRTSNKMPIGYILVANKGH